MANFSLEPYKPFLPEDFEYEIAKIQEDLLGLELHIDEKDNTNNI